MECAPISLQEISKTFNDFSCFNGSRAEKLLSLLLLRFKQQRSCKASKPIKKNGIHNREIN